MNMLTITQRFPYLNRSLFRPMLTAKTNSAPISRDCSPKEMRERHLRQSCTFGKQITSQSSRNAAATASATLS